MMSPSRNPAAAGRPVLLERDDEHAGGLRQLVEAGDAAQQRHVLAGDAQIAAPHPAVAEQRRQHRRDRVDRHREAQSLAAGDDGGVHADDLARAGDQRSARVAGIQRRVGLNHLIDQPSRIARAASVPSALTTPADTECWKPYGLPIAITSCPGRSSWELPKATAIRSGGADLEHGDVGIGILADQIGALARGRPAGPPRSPRRARPRGCW